MIAQDLKGRAHQRRQLRAQRTLGQIARNRAAQDVVRLGEAHLRAVRLVRRVDHAGVAERRRDVDGEADRRRQRGKARIGAQILHQRDSLLALDAAAVVGENPRRVKALALQRAEVDAQARLARPEHHAHARRLQRGAAGVAGARVIAEDGQDRRVAARGHAVRHGLAHAEPAARQDIDIFAVKRGQRGLAAQLRDGFIRDAVSDHKHIFHTKRLPRRASRGILVYYTADSLPRQCFCRRGAVMTPQQNT